MIFVQAWNFVLIDLYGFYRVRNNNEILIVHRRWVFEKLINGRSYRYFRKIETKKKATLRIANMLITYGLRSVLWKEKKIKKKRKNRNEKKKENRVTTRKRARGYLMRIWCGFSLTRAVRTVYMFCLEYIILEIMYFFSPYT